MTAKNSYALLTDIKDYVRSRGGNVREDIVDDNIIWKLLESASRYIDSETTRVFYPIIETNYYDTPQDRQLDFIGDVLEILSLTNGDSTAIASTEYNVVPRNLYPRYGLRLKESTSVTWQADASGNNESVIALRSINGYHERYTVAWESVTTLAEALDASELGFDLTSAASFSPGHIIRIGDEINIIDTVSGSTANVIKRGDNGSTASTHDNASTVYIWRPMADCWNACVEITYAAYMRRFGQGNTNNTVSSTAEVEMRDVPKLAQDFIKQYKRIVL